MGTIARQGFVFVVLSWKLSDGNQEGEPRKSPLTLKGGLINAPPYWTVAVLTRFLLAIELPQLTQKLDQTVQCEVNL